MSFDFFLPLLTYPDPTPAVGLLRAIDFAATLGGRLAVRAHVVDIPPIANPLARAVVDYQSLAAAAEASSKERASDLVERIKHLAHRFELPVTVDTFRARPETLGSYLTTAARTHDVTLSVIESECGGHLEAAEALLFGSGGPVVLFPGMEVPTHLQTVVVAWDGGRAAARAVRDALPVLRHARQVAVLTATEDKPIDPASLAALVAYLNGHGIAVAHHDTGCKGRSIGEALQEDAVEHDAGLLVMGAYGHNRLREFVLGGATRTVLTNLRLPVLMSH
jgi:nucleotide-binding universal stress UspA family protein